MAPCILPKQRFLVLTFHSLVEGFPTIGILIPFNLPSSRCAQRYPHAIHAVSPYAPEDVSKLYDHERSGWPYTRAVIKLRSPRSSASKFSADLCGPSRWFSSHKLHLTMYIPTTVLPADFATPLDVLRSTSSAHHSIYGRSIVLVRRLSRIKGRAGYAVGSGVAIAFVSVFLLVVLARCIIREQRARKQARVHVQALAIQDREFWGVDVNSGRRIRRGEEDEDDEIEVETEAERRIRRRQERRAREHGKFDSVLERMEKLALQEEGLKESTKMSGGRATELVSEKESSEESKSSGSSKESDISRAVKVTIPEPVYLGAGARFSSGGRMSLSNLRSSIS